MRNARTTRWAALCLPLLLTGCDAGTGDNQRFLPDGGSREGGAVSDATTGSEGGAADASTGGADGASGDTSSVYDVVPSSDAPTCDGGGACTPRATGCGSAETCDDGLDNDCNGRVDEVCNCIPGTVQRCFLGPPGLRGVGTCADGQQTCQGSGEFGTWGPCVGGIAPSAETCDGADNNCNGCSDEGLCCQPAGTCPSAGDPRVPTGRPFAAYSLDGASFFPGPARAWRWHLEGGPCDQLLYATRSRVSFTLGTPGADPRESTAQRLDFRPALSGDYRATLTVSPMSGPDFTCTFTIPVRAPGLRVELCWDRTGDITTTGTDVDLWLHDPRNTGAWGQIINDDTCGPYNCFNRSTDNPLALANPNWGYAATPGGACLTPDTGNVCNNPRIDVDNNGRTGTGRSDFAPENINVDRPRDNDQFRVAAQYFRGTGAVHPMVNIYCGGALRATYGGAMVGSTLYGSTPLSNFDTAGRSNDTGSLWRIADVRMHEPMDTCDLVPLVPSASGTGPCVQTGTDRSYDGNCRRRP